MPEITNRERIIKKLREFDERMDGAITAAKILAEVKADALQKKDFSEGIWREIIEAQESLQDIHVEWDDLKSDITKARESLINEIHQTLINHQELELLSREHQKKTAVDRETIIAQANQLQRLLNSLRQDLGVEIKGNLSQAEKLIQIRIDEIEKDFRAKIQVAERGIEEKTEKLHDSLHGEMEVFKKYVKKELSEHQQGVERNLTDFLNKQNILVQNLTQQIDGFHRSAQTLSSQQGQLQIEVAGLEEKITNHSARQDAGIRRISDEMSVIARRLEQVITRLQDRPLLGRYFNNI